MRDRRLTFKGAYHHIMNRGFDKMPIFSGWKNKAMFIEMMKASLKIYKMRIFAFCIMSNHFHIVMQNSNERMGDFFRNLLGRYALYYNKTNKRNGYVYGDRYRSTLIQDDNYLRMSVLYTFLNPVRKGIVYSPYDYRWSSISSMYCTDNLTDTAFIEQLFNGQRDFNEQLGYWAGGKKLQLVKSRYGTVLGKCYYIYKALHIYNKRRHESGQKYNMRKRDRHKKYNYDEIRTLYLEEENVDIDEKAFITNRDKKMRLRILIDLREMCGMTYRDIVLTRPFRNVKYKSLSGLYSYAKKRL